MSNEQVTRKTLEDFEFVNVRPEEVTDEQWEGLWSTHQRAILPEMNDLRSEEEIARFIGTPESFRANKLEPAARGHFNTGQRYLNPRLFMAIDEGIPIGFAYMADNVSGDRQQLKHFLHRDYRTATEFAVRPNYQRRGIAMAFWGGFIATTGMGRHMTGYTLPSVLPEGEQFAWRVMGHRSETGTQPKQPFGTEETVMQRRYEISRREAERNFLRLAGKDRATQQAVRQLVKAQPVKRLMHWSV